MNKLIYAIGIAVATTFVANPKFEKISPLPIEKPSIEQIEKLLLVNTADSVDIIV